MSIHTPVMLAEVLKALAPKANAVYVDATFGAGGYTKSILSAASCKVYGIDRDPDASKRGQALEKDTEKRFTIVEGNFKDLDHLLAAEDIHQVDGVVFDLGVSSPQLDEAQRGFSFQKEGPLDMRMAQQGPTAADFVNNAAEEKLAHIIWTYGDEPKSRRIAKAIVAQRKIAPFLTTLQLAQTIHRVVPKRPHQKIDSATKTFQAIRIHINEELEALAQGMEAAIRVLKPEGRLAVVSFHALEDGYVKRFMKWHSGRSANPSRYQPDAAPKADPLLALDSMKAEKPTAEEINANPRARSARLRWATRTNVPCPVLLGGAP